MKGDLGGLDTENVPCLFWFSFRHRGLGAWGRLEPFVCQAKSRSLTLSIWYGIFLGSFFMVSFLLVFVLGTFGACCYEFFFGIHNGIFQGVGFVDN